MNLRAALAIVVPVVCAWAPNAAADKRTAVAVAKYYYQLDLPQSFTAENLPQTGTVTTTQVVARYRGPGDANAVIVHAKFPNRRAWQKRADFFAEVERGVRSSSEGYRELRRRQGRLGRVPYLDLSFTRIRDKSRHEVHLRYLFFRTFTVSLALEAPAAAPRAMRRLLRATRDSFRPYFKPSTP